MTNEWFRELEGIYTLLPDYGVAYAKLQQLYMRLLDEVTAESDAILAGCFAKTDYLLKRKSAGAGLRRMVNEARLNLTRNTETRKPESFIYDFQALCLFVSLLYEEPVPAGLSRAFPAKRRFASPSLLLGDCMRMVLDSWDDEMLFCTGEMYAGGVNVKYSGAGQLFGYDHSYIGGLLRKGMMLNIVRPRMADGGVLLPEFIILEPDVLVDISTIASSFESYAESPLLAWLKRMEPSAQSEAILMGNMAGELLDGVLHAASSDMLPYSSELYDVYKSAALGFFRRNVLGIMDVKPEKAFHSQAWQQLVNISNALNKTMPAMVKRFERGKIMVEPTFFSEMLGLQGRMDMLQSDMSVLVEQKAGKGAFVPGHGNEHTDAPRYKQQHYMQMLLYMAIIRYNYRQTYEANDGELYAFLMYSKYSRPLVGMSFAPELLFRAMKMRNLYVAQERAMCEGEVGKIMALHADDFNINGVGDTLWQQYHRPRIESILMRFRNASALERAYFERFYRFIALEHRLSKIGNQLKESSGFAKAWLSPLEEKIQAGDILCNLEICSPPDADSTYIEHVVVRYDGEAGNFRQGDIAVFYPYVSDSVPDLRQTFVFRATIISIQDTEITLRLRHPQMDSGIFMCRDNVRWCLEHDFMESSFASLYKGLYAFLGAPLRRRELFLLQRLPELSAGEPLRGDYGVFNELQQRIKRARELFLIIGPPGTGKTSFGMLNTLQEELHKEASRILIVSYTNRAVDEICSKLHPETDFIRIGGLCDSSSVYRHNLFGNIVAECSNVRELEARIRETRVITATTSSVMSHLPLIAKSRFSLCIIDEAGQIPEPHLLPLLSLCCSDGQPGIEKFVMIGDHKQLPAVVQQRGRDSRVEERILHEIGLTDCRKSMFERLLGRYRHNPDVCYMLTRQGRMHKDIAHFPNISFYGGLLREVPLAHQEAPSPSSRLRFIDVASPADTLSDKTNISEAEIIVDELFDIWQSNSETFNPEETVGVIVPYRNQISVIRSMLSERLRLADHPLMHITIDTVERFQGSQRKYIIYGITIRKQYQLRFLTDTTFEEDGLLIDRKLNVAMTRAMEYLTIVGNGDLMRRVPLFVRLLDFISANGEYRS